MKKTIFLFSVLFISTPLFARQGNPPVTVESLIADHGINISMTVSKKLQSIPKLGFFSATSLTTDWNTSALNDLMNQGALTFKLARGVDLMGGYHFVPVNGIHGSAGIIGTIPAKDLLIIVVPRFDLSRNYGYEGFLSATYKPQINEHFSFYSRFQGLYSALFKNGTHQRSYAWFRVGLSRQDITFGLGASLDYYGPFKANTNNYGIFVNVNLF